MLSELSPGLVNIIFLSTLSSHKWTLPFKLPNRNVVYVCHILHPYTLHSSHPFSFTQIIGKEQIKSSTVCNFLHFLLTYTILKPKYILCALLQKQDSRNERSQTAPVASQGCCFLTYNGFNIRQRNSSQAEAYVCLLPLPSCGKVICNCSRCKISFFAAHGCNTKENNIPTLNIKSGRIRWAGHEACMVQLRKCASF